MMRIPVGLKSYTELANRQLGPFRPNEGYWLGNQFLFPQALSPAFIPPAMPSGPQADQEAPPAQAPAQSGGLLGGMGPFGDGGAGNGFGDRDPMGGSRGGFSEGLNPNDNGMTPGSQPGPAGVPGTAPGPSAMAAQTAMRGIDGLLGVDAPAPSRSTPTSQQVADYDKALNDYGYKDTNQAAATAAQQAQATVDAVQSQNVETKSPAEEAGFGTTGKTGWGRPDVQAFSTPNTTAPTTATNPNAPTSMNQVSIGGLLGAIGKAIGAVAQMGLNTAAASTSDGQVDAHGNSTDPTAAAATAAAMAEAQKSDPTVGIGSDFGNDYGGGDDGDNSGAGVGDGQSGGTGESTGHGAGDPDSSGGGVGGGGTGGGAFRKGGHTGDDGDKKLEAVPIVAHEGEFVQRPEAVKRYGVRFMEAINNLEIPKGKALGLLAGMEKMKPKSRGRGLLG